MNESTKSKYRKRFSRVLDYIYDHLDEDINLSRMAEVACLSPFHWHRVYKGYSGETIAQTVKRIRLHRAAAYLTKTDLSISEVAIKCGYPNQQSSTRIFRDAYGYPPATYRVNGGHMRYNPDTDDSNGVSFDVAVEDRPQVKGVSLVHKGNYTDIGRTFEALVHELGPESSQCRFSVVYYDDASITPPENLRSRVCAFSDREMGASRRLDPVVIHGGKYAVLTHVGPHSETDDAYDWLFGRWLIDAGHEAADAPIVLNYLNSPKDTLPTKLVTEVCLLLK